MLNESPHKKALVPAQQLVALGQRLIGEEINDQIEEIEELSGLGPLA